MQTNVGRPAVFLDRDGVINENRADYVKTWSEFVLLPGSLAALLRLAESPLVVVVVTSQSAVGRGLMLAETVDEIHHRLLAEVTAAGGRIDGFYVCPHTPEDRCACRKPEPGLFLQAAADLGLDLRASYCVGDKLSDLAAGTAVGCCGILVLTGEGRRQALGSAHGTVVVADLGEAVDLILAEWAAPLGATAQEGTRR